MVKIYRNGLAFALKCMRITTLLIAIQVITASLLMARESKAQSISLDVKQIPVPQVLKLIEKQTTVTFAYNDKALQNLPKVSLKFTNQPLSRILNAIEKQAPLQFHQNGNLIGVLRTEQQNDAVPPEKAEKPKPQPVKGKVADEKGQPLPGVTIRDKKTGLVTYTNENGDFQFNNLPDSATLVFSFIGYLTQELQIMATTFTINVSLKPDIAALKEVSVVSTGYQEIPLERATGSFSQVNNELISRRVSTDVISRIEDVVPGLINNKGRGAAAALVIRGQTTITSNAQPLIVVDNFPYENDITNINPNDVESVTVLKDAAAASIWGARAGNGVIVITTKKGKYNQKPIVSLNTNVTVGDKPNIFYQPIVSSADFIEIEKSLFAKGIYGATESSTFHYPLTPVAELLIAKRDNKISATDADNQIEVLKNIDVRNDYEKYLYRKSVNQQYAMNINGGNDNQRYYFSAGYDKNLQSLVANDYDRVTLNASNTYSFLNRRLQFTTGIYYTDSKTTTNNTGVPTYTSYDGSTSSLNLYPYARLADDQGKALPVINDYRLSYLQDAQSKGLLDWQYRPLDEINLADNTSKTTDYRLNTSLKYTIIDGLNAEILYQYGRNIIAGRNLQSQQTYYARDLINQYTQVDATGAITRPVPLGGIMDLNNKNIIAQNFRGQLNYTKDWTGNNISALAGYEIRDQHTVGYNSRRYGYDPEHASSQVVNYTSLFLLYPFGYSLAIPNRETESDLTDRYRSYYANAAYTYKGRYIISGSGRIDQSNLFGVNTNQKGVPLYSIGAAWNLSNEQFYHVELLPVLKLRATYGYSGNVNKSLSAYTTASYSPRDPLNRLPFASIQNPPNPDLRWEKVKTINFAVDFSSKNDRIGGTIEIYKKNGYDIIGTLPYTPSAGITSFTGNYANTLAQGIELTINTKNIDGVIKWYSNFLFSHATDKVTSYVYNSLTSSSSSLLGSGDGLSIIPRQGYPLFAVYSYKWAGLDPQTGDPQGYLNGQVSKDWQGIFNNAQSNPDHLIFNGPARPTYFGSFRNTLAFNGFSLTANITYRLGYYFRKTALNYTTVLKGYGGIGDYGSRWQKAGDEQFTSVPSVPATTNTFRSGFYQQSEVLVQKGDHIRLQDLTISYSLDRKLLNRSPITALQFYLYANNLGIIWKATKTNLDPDYPFADYPPIRTIALGARASF